jgi:SAM-dependent methyltransferase
MIHTYCPIDDTDTNDDELFPANFDASTIDATHFSARRAPDRIHYRMVRNRNTGCVRADPVFPPETLGQLYKDSRVTYQDLGSYATATYLDHLRQAIPLLPNLKGLLEIGAGAGWFLEAAAREANFDRIAGVEPSGDAVAQASSTIRPHLAQGLFETGLYPPGSFSIVCGFQVLDHLLEPNRVLTTVSDLLVPDGVTLWICHDVAAPLNRALGRLSPIVDIEHVVLYDRRTIRKLFERNGFEVLRIFGVANRYPLWYWTQLAPLPRVLREPLVRAIRPLKATLMMNLGNMGILARKSR